MGRTARSDGWEGWSKGSRFGSGISRVRGRVGARRARLQRHCAPSTHDHALIALAVPHAVQELQAVMRPAFNELLLRSGARETCRPGRRPGSPGRGVTAVWRGSAAFHLRLSARRTGEEAPEIRVPTGGAGCPSCSCADFVGGSWDGIILIVVVFRRAAFGQYMAGALLICGIPMWFDLALLR